MSIAALILIGLAIIACGVLYHIYTWLQVDPIAVDSDASETERIAALDSWLEKLFDKYKFNGGVLIIRNGKVLLSKTCGFTDQFATQQLNEHSAFQLASVSKQFTAAGVLRLAEKGLLRLDDPIAVHIDGFNFKKVTIRHLLNQTSGIPDEYMKLAKQHRKGTGAVLTNSMVVELIKRYSKLTYQPGDIMEYSNTNYVLLAAIVEAVSGMSFEKFMSEEVFKPLGMNDTRVWNLLSGERSSNQACDFLLLFKKRLAHKIPWIDGVTGDGAVFCSLNDFVIWDQFWYGNSLISDALLQEAFKRPFLNDRTQSDYGFGWFLAPKCHWHTGGWLGSNTYIARYPESRSAVIVLDNSSNFYRSQKIVNTIESVIQNNQTDEASLVEPEIN
ncbi:serine hydrolase domain-containing protein [Thalassotalea ganghwensis]